MLETTLDALTAGPLRSPGIAHAYFTRRGGVSDGLYASLNAGEGSRDAAGDVRENKRRIAAALGVDAGSLVAMHQTHSADVLTVASPPVQRPRVDAMASATQGIALMVLTADCAPVLLADAEARVIGAAHAGWRGAYGGVLEATVAAMEALGASRAGIAAAIGPTIAQASYEVGPGFAAPIIGRTPAARELFAPSDRPEHQRFDLPGYVRLRLRQAGVGTVHDLALDTYADERRFFSYRRATHRGEPDYGRLASAIVLER